MFLTRPPHPALAPFVESLWLVDGAPLAHRFERVMPTGAMQLLVNLHADRLGDGERGINGAGLSGVHDRAKVIDTATQRRIAGVAFRPGAGALLGVPAHLLADRMVELADLWPKTGAALRERVLACDSPRAVLATLEAFLLARAADVERDGALSFAIDALARGASVGGVIEAIGWSERRFHTRFLAAVGTTPKRYARIRRFQRVLERAVRPDAESWAALAATCGYFDQAHLIRDFRALSGGLTPGRYVPRTPGERNHVPVADGNVQDALAQLVRLPG
ncbi:MAG: DUF6597 domain-containing transcriptional factor [Kofleriaceae bacterium]